MHSQARAVWFTSQRSVEIRPAPLASLAPDQVLVRTLFSGVSPGTEMLAYRGELDEGLAQDESIEALDGTFQYPFRYGYSAVGIVEQSQAEIPVGTQVFAFHPHQDRFTVSASDAIPIEGLSPREATLFPLVETALQVTLDADVEPGQEVVVMGLGPVGSLVAILLARSGVQVIGVDPLPWRRAALVGVGDPEPLTAEPDSALATITDGGHGPVSLVIEASGNPSAMRLGLELLAHEGTLMVASWFGTRDVPLPLGRNFHRRRLTISSTQVSTIPNRLKARWNKNKRRHAVVRLLGELPLSNFATHTFPFEEASEAYAAIDRRQDGLIHSALGYD